MGDVVRNLVFGRKDWECILAHVKQLLPEEACGLVGGRNNVAKVVFAISNELKSPVRFRMDPQEQINAFLAIESQGLDLLAIYHSHPSGPAHPSQTDLEAFAYPGVLYIIYSLQNEEWVGKGFQFEENGYREIPLVVIDSE